MGNVMPLVSTTMTLHANTNADAASPFKPTIGLVVKYKNTRVTCTAHARICYSMAAISHDTSVDRLFTHNLINLVYFKAILLPYSQTKV